MEAFMETMNGLGQGAFVYYTIPILGGIRITQTAVSSFIVMLILCTAFILLGRKIEKRPGKMQVLVEKGVDMITNMTVSAMGSHNIGWTPFMGCLFLCSLFGSYIGTTGFLRSATADINCTATWALMVSFIIWYNTIKYNGWGSFLKNYINPMNIISEVSQPLSMSFRHFSNVSVGGIIGTILYAALTLASTVVIGAIASAGWLTGSVLMIAGVVLFLLGRKRKKLLLKIIAIATFVIGTCGLLEAVGVLSGVPIFTYGIPAVLSVYFDFFSGFIQALVFTLLSMVYIAGSIPEPENKNT